VGSKELSVRQGLAVSKVDQWISGALKGDGNTSRSDGNSSDENTIDEMLRHSQVKKHGTFGRLSANQQSLITSVVSVMQDKVAGDAKRNAESLKDIILAEREALKAMSHSFTSTAKSLYQLPLIGSLKKSEDIEDVTTGRFSNRRHDEDIIESEKNYADTGVSSDIGRQRSWVHFFSWGNMISIAAIVLLVLVVKTSVETANFETQYHNAISDVDTLELSLDAKEKKYEGLLSELQLANVKIAGLESSIDGLKHNAVQKQVMLEATIQKQDSQLRKLQRLSASAQATLNSEIKLLQANVAQFKGKEIDGAQKNEIWKQLAKERKEELNQLQSQILTLSELSRKEVSTEEDKGWSLF